MKRSKKPTKPNKYLPALRAILGLSQIEFAQLLGVSPDLIGSIEIGRAKLSRKVHLRIYLATGCSGFPLVVDCIHGLDYESDQLRDHAFEPYTLDSFRAWKQLTTEAVADEMLKPILAGISVIFQAACKERRGKRGKLFPLALSLEEWVFDAMEAFDLGREIEAVLKEKKKSTERGQAFDTIRQTLNRLTKLNLNPPILCRIHSSKSAKGSTATKRAKGSSMNASKAADATLTKS